MKPETLYLPTGAGHNVAARHFESASKDAKGVCIISCATGVAQYLYDDFAVWLTKQGYQVVTFDYDGIGLSVEDHVKDSKSDKMSWANHDCPTVLTYVAETFPSLERIWIGHSIGGHLPGMMPDTKLIDRIITVGAGTGTWWYNAWPTRRIAWLLWYVIVPVTVPIFGYFPGDKLGILCDMPKGVIMQWRRWCLHRNYSIGKEGSWLRDRYASVKAPITSIIFTDDEMMSVKNTDLLHAFYTNSTQKRVVVQPSDIGQKRIGHIGWHRQRFETLWEEVFKPELEGRI
jgi:predicted alpha/beta hydrolase